MPGEAREKCAVMGVASSNPETHAAILGHEVLFALQHRGTEASGMVSQEAGSPMQVHRGSGMVLDVYDAHAIEQLQGPSAIGQNKYSTSGSKTGHLQPVIDEDTGFSLGHNGNLPDTTVLENDLERKNIPTNHLNDSEMMGLAIAQRIKNGLDLPDAIRETYPLFKGAFSCVAMHDGLVVAFRDEMGIRPLSIGRFYDGFVVSSETCGLDTIDATFVRDVDPGEMIVVTGDSIESYPLAEGQHKLDMFEFAYFARPDSILYGQTVDEVRYRFGEALAEEHPPIVDDFSKIIVVPVPDTSVPEAEGYADKLGIKMAPQAIVKNRYIGRTFMQPSQEMRNTQLKRKHNIIPKRVYGKHVIILDDSIVRLNTLPRIVEQAYQKGALSVMVLIGSPPVMFPDFYGIDTPNQSELAAANMTIEQMRIGIGCKYLGFLSLESMVEATGSSEDKFNLSCFTGDYPIDIGKRWSEIKRPVSMDDVK